MNPAYVHAVWVCGCVQLRIGIMLPCLCLRHHSVQTHGFAEWAARGEGGERVDAWGMIPSIADSEYYPISFLRGGAIKGVFSKC